MDIRLYTESDRVALQAVYLESRRQAFEWLDVSSINQNDFDRDTEGEKIWVVTKENMPIGFISAWIQENFIHNLFVHPREVGKGVGSALLQTCLDNIGRPAVLKCAARNTKALEFYLSRHWKVVSQNEDSHGRYFFMNFESET